MLVNQPAVFALSLGVGTIDRASLVAAAPLVIAKGVPAPLARLAPAAAEYDRLLESFVSCDVKARPIRFHVNFSVALNGYLLEFSEAGLNGVPITALVWPPASRFGTPSPLAQDYGADQPDAGDEIKPGAPVLVLAADVEAFEAFENVDCRKLRDAVVVIMQAAYKKSAETLSCLSSSEGERAAPTCAQRSSDDSDGVFYRVARHQPDRLTPREYAPLNCGDGQSLNVRNPSEALKRKQRAFPVRGAYHVLAQSGFSSSV
jgi:feruloyl esterase